jgi:glycosyltransferase involved in cell wall biosynthesis
MSCTGIIPFFNEGQRIFKVLDVITKVKGLSHIICVDDGSAISACKQIKRRYKQIKVIRLSKNHGKAYAVRIALQQSNDDYIFLMDADISNISQNEIMNALAVIKSNKSIDMLILRRISPLEAKFIRADIIFSGERILKRHDLIKIFQMKPVGYQLEIAINHYM